jgi:hypothetical protein
MPLPVIYTSGTVSVANGGTTVTGAGTLWGDDAIMAGDLFCDPAQPLVPPQRIASVTDDGELELAVGWPGTAMSDDAYEIRFVGIIERSTAQTRRLLEQLSVVQANGRGLFYLFSDTTTDADPGAGYIRLNNADPTLATAAYLDVLDANGATVSAILDSWDDEATAAARGQLWLRGIADPSTFHAYKLTGSVVDGTGYRKVALTYIGGSGSFAADDEIMVAFSAQGADGTNAILGVWQGAWVTATAYDVDDLVEQDGSTYICVGAHTSGTFSTDLAADKWELAVEKGETGADSTVPGPTGPKGINWQGDYSGATAYVEDDGVLYNGSSWRALGATTGNAPPTLPTTSNTWWHLVARQGTDGAGTVVGVAAGTGISVDTTDPTNPEVNVVAFTGDSGSGGALGGVPAPASGDAAAGKVLGAGGGWVSPASAVRGHIYGLTLSPNGSDNQNLDVASGVATTDDGDHVMTLASAMTKRLDATWVQGTGNGFLDAGSIAANASYHIFLIGNSAGDVDLLASTSPTSPTMPSGWDRKRYIGGIRTGGSSTIIPFLQVGGWFWWLTPASSLASEGLTTTAELQAMFVPVGRKLLVEHFIQVSGASAGFLSMCDPDTGNAAIQDAVLPYSATENSGVVRVWTDTLAQHSFRSSTTATIANIFTRGWYDDRGQSGTIGA